MYAIDQPAISALVADPANPSTVWAGTRLPFGGVWRSTDRGVTWQRRGTGLPAFGDAVTNLYLVPVSPATLYARTGARIYKTTNAGESWSLRATLPSASVRFTLNPANPSLMFYAQEAAVFRSNDEGSNWTQAGAVPISPGLNGIAGLASSPVDPARLVAASNGPTFSGPLANGIFVSTDSGSSWRRTY